MHYIKYTQFKIIKPKNSVCTSHIIKADSQVLAGTRSPDIYALKSFSSIFNDSAVKFSMKDTAQH